MEPRKYIDRREYLIEAVRKRRKKVRLMAIQHLGGRCQNCGYNLCQEALEFHHIDQTKKEFSISQRGHSRSWVRIKKELENCDLLCANCHRETHAAINKRAHSSDGYSR